MYHQGWCQLWNSKVWRWAILLLQSWDNASLFLISSLSQRASSLSLFQTRQALESTRPSPKSQLSWPVAMFLWGEMGRDRRKQERKIELENQWRGVSPAESGVPYRAMPGIERGPFSHTATPDLLQTARISHASLPHNWSLHTTAQTQSAA